MTNRGVAGGLGGLGGLSPPHQKSSPLKPPNEMPLCTGVYGEPPFWVLVRPLPKPPLPPPSFWNVCLRPWWPMRLHFQMTSQNKMGTNQQVMATKLCNLKWPKYLKVLATIPYFNFHFFPHLLIFLQFRDPSCVLNLSTKAALQKWHN